MKHKKKIPIILFIASIIGCILYFDFFRKISLSTSRIEGSGTIEVTEIEISPKISGRILYLPFEEGSRISKGQAVAGLSYEELEPQKVSALANLSNAEKSFSRTESLYRSGSLSKQAYDNALASYRNAQSQYQYVLVNIGNARLTSPVDGIVIRKNAEMGELAFPGTPLLVIADLKKPWMKIYVSETNIGRVSIGDPVEITTDSFEKKKFLGRVVSISNKAEFTPKTIQTKEERVKLVFAVKAAIENEQELLKPGMPADAVIRTKEVK